MTDYAGVILAGGQGKRMGPLGEQYPKALLPVGDEPLIGHQLRLFSQLGITEVYIVIGHLGSQIVDVVGNGSRYGVTIQFVEQGPPLGSAFALGRLKPYLRKPFVVTLGDYYFEASHGRRLIECLDRGDSAISSKCESDRSRVMEACELRVSAKGRLEAIIEKPSAPSSPSKGCGFYAFQAEFMDSIARTPRTALRDEYELSLAIDVHLASGHGIFVEQIIETDWNFTRPRDVLDCNLHWLKGRQEPAYVATGAEIINGAVLEEVVVGTGAYVSGAACVRQGVVFPNARLDTETNCRSVLVTPWSVLRV
jgi:NDP-sugar pyrophosphorylase family protein